MAETIELSISKSPEAGVPIRTLELRLSCRISRTPSPRDEVERYRAETKAGASDGECHASVTATITVTSEAIPGLEQPYRVCKIDDVIAKDGANAVTRMAALSGLLLHTQMLCQKQEVKHLAIDKINKDTAGILSLEGFKPCSCRLPGLVNDGSQLCLPLPALKPRPKEEGKAHSVDGKTSSVSILSPHEHTTARPAQSAGFQIPNPALGNKERVLHDAKVAPPKPMPSPETLEAKPRPEQNEVEFVSERSLITQDLVRKSTPMIRTEPGLASSPQTDDDDDVQARIDQILSESNINPGSVKSDEVQTHSSQIANETNTRPDSAHRPRFKRRTPGTLGKKEYCTYYLRTGRCDYIQQGCRYKHKYPEDAETRLKLGTVPPTYQPRTPGVLGNKEYCSYYLRTGMCDYMQEGCKYKHEYPEDEETRRRLGLGREIHRWLREERQAQAFMSRNQGLMDGHDSTDGRIKAENEQFLPEGSHSGIRRSPTSEGPFRTGRSRTGNLKRASRKRSHPSSSSSLDRPFKSEDAAENHGPINDTYAANDSRYNGKHPGRSRGRRNNFHLGTQTDGASSMLGRYQVKAGPDLEAQQDEILIRGRGTGGGMRSFGQYGSGSYRG